MSFKIIEHQGKTIVHTDLSNKTKEEWYPILLEASKLVQTYPKKSLYSLINVTGFRYSKEYLNLMKERAKDNEPFIVATAVYGLTPLLQLFAKGVAQFSSRKSGFFDNEDDAKKWLSTLN